MDGRALAVLLKMDRRSGHPQQLGFKLANEILLEANCHDQ